MDQQRSGALDALCHDLGEWLAAHEVGMIRVGYRRANRIDRCVHDLSAAPA